MLRVAGARVVLGGHDALAGVDLEVAGGSIIALLGPSGSGKSTLLRAIAGLQRLDRGLGDARRPLARRSTATPERDRPHVPGRRPVPAPRRRRERRLRPADAGGLPYRCRGAGRRVARPRRARRQGASGDRLPLRRRAQARRPRAGTCAGTAGAVAGRAARSARPSAARPAGRRAERPLRRDRADGPVRDARRGRGVRGRHPGRSDAGRGDRAGRDGRTAVGIAGRRVGGAIHRARERRGARRNIVRDPPRGGGVPRRCARRRGRRLGPSGGTGRDVACPLRRRARDRVGPHRPRPSPAGDARGGRDRPRRRGRGPDGGGEARPPKTRATERPPTRRRRRPVVGSSASSSRLESSSSSGSLAVPLLPSWRAAVAASGKRYRGAGRWSLRSALTGALATPV